MNKIITLQNLSQFFTKSKANILESVYPVGAIYLSVNDVNPAVLFGFGEWEAIKDRFLLGAGDLYGGGATGGEETHTLTIDEMPSHNHNVNVGVALSLDTNQGLVAGHAPSVVDNVPRDTANVGGDQPHNNMPPYLVVMVWKRTA